jgi:hypothetical protein
LCPQCYRLYAIEIMNTACFCHIAALHASGVSKMQPKLQWFVFTLSVVRETYNQNAEIAQYAHFNPQKLTRRTRQGQLKSNETNVIQPSSYSVLLPSALLDRNVGNCYQFDTVHFSGDSTIQTLSSSQRPKFPDLVSAHTLILMLTNQHKILCNRKVC